MAALHRLARTIGLVEALDDKVHVLKRHMPYHESDHILNIALDVLAGGTCLEDLELRRQDPAYMNALGAERIPDPTTAGDFTRRFTDEASVLNLMEAINAVRPGIWEKLPAKERRKAIVDTDGTLAPTTGERKEGMGLSCTGIWGYRPLAASLANTREAIYLVNRLWKLARGYRMFAVRKNLSVEKGGDALFDDIRYFFYIANDTKMTARQAVVSSTDGAIMKTASTPCACPAATSTATAPACSWPRPRGT